MSIQTITRSITSFAVLLYNGHRIQQIVSDTGEQYIGKLVLETLPNGKQVEAMIMAIEWIDTLGLNGDWNILIAYTDPNALVPYANVGREALQLVEGE